jgi:hypothetical protein
VPAKILKHRIVTLLRRMSDVLAADICISTAKFSCEEISLLRYTVCAVQFSDFEKFRAADIRKRIHRLE